MLNIKDLCVSKELDTKTMAGVRGGFDPFAILLNGSTSLNSKVADVNQVFQFAFEQNNAGAVTNNQAITGGNGITYAPVDQSLSQGNTLSVYDVGNTWVS